MLVDRGDVLAYAGDKRSSAMYERALFFDRANAVAADRLIFGAILSHDPARIRRAISIADGELATRPADATIEMDRALCFQLLRDFRSAVRDFSDVGLRSREPRALLFAADDAAKLGRISEARTLLQLAVHDDPRFSPARIALVRVGGRL
jgi:tetratricopeptide (TPR) repeat protein